MLMTNIPRAEGSAGSGIAIGLGLNVALFFVLITVASGLGDQAPWLSTILFGALLGIGLTQLLFIVPLYLRYKKKGDKDTAKGLVIAASIVALLNATCWGVVSQIGF